MSQKYCHWSFSSAILTDRMADNDTKKGCRPQAYNLSFIIANFELITSPRSKYA